MLPFYRPRVRMNMAVHALLCCLVAGSFLPLANARRSLLFCPMTNLPNLLRRTFLLAGLCTLLRGAEVAPTARFVVQAGFARADITPDARMINWIISPARPY